MVDTGRFQLVGYDAHMNTYIFTWTGCSQKQQVLVFVEKPRDIVTQLHEIDHIVTVPVVLVHTNIRTARHAVVWRTVQLRRRDTTDKFQHVSHSLADRVPGEYIPPLIGVHVPEIAVNRCCVVRFIDPDRWRLEWSHVQRHQKSIANSGWRHDIRLVLYYFGLVR